MTERESALANNSNGTAFNHEGGDLWAHFSGTFGGVGVGVYLQLAAEDPLESFDDDAPADSARTWADVAIVEPSTGAPAKVKVTAAMSLCYRNLPRCRARFRTDSSGDGNTAIAIFTDRGMQLQRPGP